MYRTQVLTEEEILSQMGLHDKEGTCMVLSFDEKLLGKFPPNLLWLKSLQITEKFTTLLAPHIIKVCNCDDTQCFSAMSIKQILLFAKFQCIFFRTTFKHNLAIPLKINEQNYSRPKFVLRFLSQNWLENALLDGAMLMNMFENGKLNLSPRGACLDSTWM